MILMRYLGNAAVAFCWIAAGCQGVLEALAQELLQTEWIKGASDTVIRDMERELNLSGLPLSGQALPGLLNDMLKVYFFAFKHERRSIILYFRQQPSEIIL